MSKKILMMDCHPWKKSLSHNLFEQYINGATRSGNEIRSMRISEMRFDSDLSWDGDSTVMEASLIEFQENITWCEHVVFIHPLWWGLMPAKMKGLIDRTFLSGFAYEYDGKSSLPKKLLQGKSADILITSDTPNWIFKLFYKSALFTAMKTQIFGFVGFKPTKFIMFSPVRGANDASRKKWMKKAFDMGKKVV